MDILREMLHFFGKHDWKWIESERNIVHNHKRKEFDFPKGHWLCRRCGKIKVMRL
jgi:hypothetical protein